jgi:hypothetical protein
MEGQIVGNDARTMLPDERFEIDFAVSYLVCEAGHDDEPGRRKGTAQHFNGIGCGVDDRDGRWLRQEAPRWS